MAATHDPPVGRPPCVAKYFRDAMVGEAVKKKACSFCTVVVSCRHARLARHLMKCKEASPAAKADANEYEHKAERRRQPDQPDQEATASSAGGTRHGGADGSISEDGGEDGNETDGHVEGAAATHAAGASAATTPAATLTPEAFVEHATAKVRDLYVVLWLYPRTPRCG